MSSSVKVKEMSSAGHSERKSSPLHWWGVRTGLQNSKLPSATAFPGSQPTHAPLSLKFLLSIRLAGVNDWWWEQSQIVLQVFNSVRSKIVLYISPVPPFICHIVGVLLAKILSFSAQWSWMKNVETEFGGNRKVALIFSWWRGEHSRLLPQNLCLPPHHPATLRSLSPVQFSRSVVSDSFRPHAPQHARPPCPLPVPTVHPYSQPLSRWCHPTISSSAVLFSSCLQSFPASGSFQMSQFFASGGWSIGVSLSASVLPMNIQNWFPLGWTGWISLQSKGLSRVFSIPQFKSINSSVLSFLYSPTLTSIHDYWENHSLD